MLVFLPKSLTNKKGDLSILVIVALLLIAVIALSNVKLSNPSGLNPTSQCYISPPDSSQAITFNGKQYNLIRYQAPTITRFISTHLDQKPNIEVGGKSRKLYSPWFDHISQPGHYTSLLFYPIIGIDSLLYADMSDDVKFKHTGITYFNIYLEDGRPVPQFIIDYCNSNTAHEYLPLWIDNQDVSFPPVSFKASQLSNLTPGDCAKTGTEPGITIPGIAESIRNSNGSACNSFPGADTIYYLTSYDNKGSFVDRELFSLYGWPRVTLNLEKDGQIKSYSGTYISGSTNGTIVLRDNDSNSPDKDKIFIYSPNFTLTSDPEATLKRLNPNPTNMQTLQIQAVQPYEVPPWGWWTPECKPAIYLYPQQITNINVKVFPKGFLTFTDPLYPQDTGWNITAHPNGDIYSNNQIYPYLYYESKIKDSEFTKPTQGYVIPYSQLSNKFYQLLPQLGLNQKETQNFADYWLKTLPQANYYFIGIMDQPSINHIEPLEITPQPETNIRVRLYFEALDTPKQVTPPTISRNIQRLGFSMVEWGGMVKVDKDHPFTCSQ